MQNATRTGWSTLLALCALLALPILCPAAESLEHTVQPGDNLIKICGQYRDRTNHYSLNDLLTAIREANGMESNFLKIGRKLEIPFADAEPPARVARKVADGAEMRGIYLTGPACGVSSVWERVDSFVEAGGNAVVFDAKDIDGRVSYLSGHALASYGSDRSSPVISSLSDMMSRFGNRDLYVVARLALFLDGELGARRPDLAHHDAEGNPWRERGCYWMDPAQDDVQEYNLALAVELARAGVNEIQFDYVRFPTNGWTGDAGLDRAAVAERRRAVLESFLARARATLDEFDVRISADLYGIMAWGRVEDLALTGQHVPMIAKYVDVICPMIYPSHFGPGFEGRRRPGDDPAYFVGEGTRRFAELAGSDCEIRPWLQAFPYGVTTYNEKYVRVQIETSRTAGGSGWCLWNPTCRYTVALGAVGPADFMRPEPVAAVEVPILAQLSERPALPAKDQAQSDVEPVSRPGRERPAPTVAAGVSMPGAGSVAPLLEAAERARQPRR